MTERSCGNCIQCDKYIDREKAIEDLEKTINHKLGDKEIGIVNAFACIFEALVEKAEEDGET